MYKRFGDAPLWLESRGVRNRASALLRALEQAPRHGLNTNAYPLDSVRAVVNSNQLAKNRQPTALAAADVMLSAAFVAYASDMWKWLEAVLAGDFIIFTHTEVGPRFEGRGVAAALVRHSLDDARRRGLTVIPLCPFYQGWIQRHPQHHDVLYQPPPSRVRD